MKMTKTQSNTIPIESTAVRYLVAMDSFKGSLSSIEAANAVKEGILRANPEAIVNVCPLADGGEGTVEALINGMNGSFQSVKVSDPLGKTIDCKYGIIHSFSSDKGNDGCDSELCAVIEAAGACGLYLVPDDKRNPLYTTTYGLGEVILDALVKGCRKFIIGIGGSSTNDGGIGMLEALGAHFLDKDGNEISHGAIGLKNLHSIDVSGMNKELCQCSFMIACDVDNPLCGENGCSQIFARQKGADYDSIEKMDRWMDHYADLTCDTLKENKEYIDKDYPSTGAAGGLGFAFKYYLGGELKPGIDIVIKETGLLEYVKNADVIITGEGCLDAQTSMGKAPVGLARAVKACDPSKKVVALAGKLGEGAEECKAHGIDECYGITDYIHYDDFAEYMDKENAYSNLSKLAENIFKS